MLSYYTIAFICLGTLFLNHCLSQLHGRITAVDDGDGASQKGSLSRTKGGNDEWDKLASHRRPARHHEDRPGAGKQEGKR